jgi:thiosulfate dehydrogenase
MKGLVIGFLLGVLLLAGGAYYYFASGMAPAATADAPMPFEKRMAHMALDAHIRKESVGQPAVPADEQTFIAGANVYKAECSACHGVPAQRSEYTTAMYPPPPQLFPGKGVSDDPVSETYWKVVNGIRLTGMPAFKNILSDAQMWQVSQFLAHSNELPASVSKLLASNAPGAK